MDTTSTPTTAENLHVTSLLAIHLWKKEQQQQRANYFHSITIKQIGVNYWLRAVGGGCSRVFFFSTKDKWENMHILENINWKSPSRVYKFAQSGGVVVPALSNKMKRAMNEHKFRLECHTAHGMQKNNREQQETMTTMGEVIPKAVYLN